MHQVVCLWSVRGEVVSTNSIIVHYSWYDLYNKRYSQYTTVSEYHSSTGTTVSTINTFVGFKLKYP